MHHQVVHIPHLAAPAQKERTQSRSSSVTIAPSSAFDVLLAPVGMHPYRVTHPGGRGILIKHMPLPLRSLSSANTLLQLVLKALSTMMSALQDHPAGDVNL